MLYPNSLAQALDRVKPYSRGYKYDTMLYRSIEEVSAYLSKLLFVTFYQDDILTATVICSQFLLSIKQQKWIWTFLAPNITRRLEGRPALASLTHAHSNLHGQHSIKLWSNKKCKHDFVKSKLKSQWARLFGVMWRWERLAKLFQMYAHITFEISLNKKRITIFLP